MSKFDDNIDKVKNYYGLNPPSALGAFILFCGECIHTRLPIPARDWMVSAKAYQQGKLTKQELDEKRCEAWKYHDSQRDTLDARDLASLRVAMYGLWPTLEENDWQESLEYLLEFAKQSGITQAELNDGIINVFGEVFK